ncbi:tetratricopeptide repeat protein [Micromonospora sp. NIE79]|uniref:Tetratricopeptide repeat protein n=1 Tax=Micromonospora trifolii TaxID=2911208 RepID=A0ABS9N3J4_9ACTN|nr:tetratricopeptide repeat protein [Micromonospora trifolii]MCG5444428.1 tetratricopeptide repeat protein [Micromonospora trifolii]
MLYTDSERGVSDTGLSQEHHGGHHGQMAGSRVGKSPWFWGLLGIAAVGLALAIRLDAAGYFADGGRAAKGWDWIERASWLAGIVALLVTTVTARTAAQSPTPPTNAGPAPRVNALPLVRDVTARQALGVHPAIPLDATADDRLSAELPLYVPRDRDVDVRTALTRMSATGGFLLLVGPPASGKTRCAAEAMQQLLGKWRLCLWSAGHDPESLLDAGTVLRRTVVWLDDLHELLEPSASVTVSTSAAGGSNPRHRRLTSELIRRLLLPENGPVILMGTTWPEKRDRFSDMPDAVEADLFADARKVVGMAEQIDMVPLFSEAEWDRAVALSGGDPRLAEAVEHGKGRALPATLASARELIRRWRHGGDAYGQAVISAAVDVRRCGHPEPIPLSLLEGLAERYLTGWHRATAAPDAWFSEALAWACRPVRGDISALAPSGSSIGIVDGYRISDMLLDHASLDPEIGAVSDKVRRYVAEHADGLVCWNLLARAYQAGKLDIAELAGRRGAQAGDARSLYNLGVLLTGSGRVEEAEALFRRAADAGDVDALNNLGVLRAGAGRAEEAEALYRRAIDAGQVKALNNLGVLRAGAGRAEEAEALYRRAIDAGDVDALISLANMLAEDGRGEEAEALYRRAVDAGHVRALFNLANLLAEDGRLEEAEALYRRAVDAGDVYALNNLALLLARAGQVEEAEALYRRAIDAGQVEALNNLAILLAEDGRLEDAEAWYRRAADAGHLDASFNLALLLAQGGRLEDAETWYRRAADAGHANALNNLANMLARRGRFQEAEALYRRAADTGDLIALNNLATLLAEHDKAEAGGHVANPPGEGRFF